eukprot:TRINITY_DN11539_c5_g1_i1.p1 TRINITY_DN11539_c5_g1~~TRINITY_DN11539_c5_g1_i1.p1  ORF type:complete len:507 (+),score=92.82 TRINITY_DN11539_c5_g1_i1:201-1523(+)
MDLIMKLLEDRQDGAKRFRLSASLAKAQKLKKMQTQELGKEKGTNSWHSFAKDNVVAMCNEVLSDLMQNQVPQMVPEIVFGVIDVINATLADFRAGSMVMRMVLPKALPNPPPEGLIEELVQGIPKIGIRHSHVRKCKAVEEKISSATDPNAGKRFASPTAAAAAGVSCFSLVGCLGFGCHTGALACFSGCGAGVAEIFRRGARTFVPAINSWNEQACADAAASPEPVFDAQKFRVESKKKLDPSTKAVPSSSSTASAHQPPEAAKIQLPREHIPKIADYIRSYVLAELPIAKLIGMKTLGIIERMLIRGLAKEVLSSGTSSPTLPLVVNIEVPEMILQLGFAPLLLPRMNFGVFLELNLQPGGPYISDIHITMTDEVIDQVIDVVRTQIVSIDLRTIDPRLESFTDPLHLDVEISVNWASEEQLRLDLSKLKVHLGLPH